jgi:hypothetical protein
VEWTGTAGVAYTIYSAETPDAAAAWHPVGFIAATNEDAVLSIEIDTGPAHRIFKAVSQ